MLWQTKRKYIEEQRSCTLLLRSGASHTVRAGDGVKVGRMFVSTAAESYALNNIWCVIGDSDVLIDWALVPPNMLAGFTVDQVRSAYATRASVRFFENRAVSIGPARLMPTSRTVASGRVLPNGWRVINGGAA